MVVLCDFITISLIVVMSLFIDVNDFVYFCADVCIFFRGNPFLACLIRIFHQTLSYIRIYCCIKICCTNVEIRINDIVLSYLPSHM